MSIPILPAVAAFGNKCGLEETLFLPSRFRGPSGVGIQKGVALSRVAAWAAVLDIWKIQHCLTPGQATTIIDGAPMLMGAEGVKTLEGISSSAALSEFVTENAPKWEAGAVALAQFWSLNRAAHSKMPEDFLYNSSFTQGNLAQVALAAAYARNGVIDADNPAAVFSTLSLENGLAKRMLDASKEGTVSANPSSFADRAATTMMLAARGDFESIASSGVVEPFVKEARDTADRDPKCIQHPCDYAAGAFLGSRHMADVKQLDRAKPSSSETLERYLQRTPSGHYASMAARAFDLDGRLGDDLTLATMRGMESAHKNFSPLFLAGQSITAVKGMRVEAIAKEEKAKHETFSLFGDEEFGRKAPVKATSEPETPVSEHYFCSRLPGQIEIWTKKMALQEIEKTHSFKLPRSVGHAIGLLRPFYDEFVEKEKCSPDEAMEMAIAEVALQAEENPKKKIDPNSLPMARLYLENGGVTTSLDIENEDGRSRHEMIGVDPDMISDDFREEWGLDAPPTPEFQTGTYSSSSGSGQLTMPHGFTDRFDVVHEILSNTCPAAAQRLEDLANGSTEIQTDDIKEMQAGLMKAFPDNAVAKGYCSLLAKTHEIVQTEVQAQRNMFSGGELSATVSDERSVGERLTERLNTILAANTNAAGAEVEVAR